MSGARLGETSGPVDRTQCMRFVCALAAVGLLAGCPAREIDGNPPPHFAILDDLDRTPDPACEGHWVAGIRGRVIDARGAGIAPWPRGITRPPPTQRASRRRADRAYPDRCAAPIHAVPGVATR